MSVTFTDRAVGVQAADAVLSDWPIPSEDVVAGNPQASGVVISRSPDARLLRGIWRCTPGAFAAHFTWDETLVVLEGRVTVALADGQVIELVPGVVAFFGRGVECTWTVHEPTAKGFHIDSPDPVDL
jgi:uncharacterized cupin superfamily protein